MGHHSYILGYMFAFHFLIFYICGRISKYLYLSYPNQMDLDYFLDSKLLFEASFRATCTTQ